LFLSCSYLTDSEFKPTFSISQKYTFQPIHAISFSRKNTHEQNAFPYPVWDVWHTHHPSSVREDAHSNSMPSQIAAPQIQSHIECWHTNHHSQFGVMGWTCSHCGCMMRLRAVAIYPPATTKILQGLGVNLRGLGFTGPP
jgi:hypothetical protein